MKTHTTPPVQEQYGNGSSHELTGAENVDLDIKKKKLGQAFF